VKQCKTPVLILPDDIPAHPYKVAMEAAMLAPNAEVSMFPWKEPKERIPLAIRQIRSFLARIERPNGRDRRRFAGPILPFAASAEPCISHASRRQLRSRRRTAPSSTDITT
jgi:hypothetical protein